LCLFSIVSLSVTPSSFVSSALGFSTIVSFISFPSLLLSSPSWLRTSSAAVSWLTCRLCAAWLRGAKYLFLKILE
jgi:hypothetical protein